MLMNMAGHPCTAGNYDFIVAFLKFLFIFSVSSVISVVNVKYLICSRDLKVCQGRVVNRQVLFTTSGPAEFLAHGGNHDSFPYFRR